MSGCEQKKNTLSFNMASCHSTIRNRGGGIMQELSLFARSWKELALRGTVALLFGVLVALWPGLTLMWLVILFAVFALAGGTISIIEALKDRSGRGRWLLLLMGGVGLAVGILALLGPALTAVMFVLIIGATAVANGVIEIMMGMRLPKTQPSRGLLIASGVVSVLFGGAMLVFPGAGALALVWLISLYAVVNGILQLVLAWRTYHSMENRDTHADEKRDSGEPSLPHDHLHHHPS
jgi:uncharacterized membrane protein HdeD (DUF308 family)